MGFPHLNTRASLKNVDTVPLITFLLHSIIIFQFVLVGISSPFVNVQIFLYEISEITSDYIFTMVHMIPCASAYTQGMEGARKGGENVYQVNVGL